MKKFNLKNQVKNNNKIHCKTILTCIEQQINGFRPGEVITIGARPGCGKTTLGLNLMMDFNNQKIKTLFVSCEMDDDELNERILLSKKIVTKEINSSFKFNENYAYFEDKGNLDIITKDIEESQVKVVIIDYLQLLDGNIKYNSKRIKELARKYQVVIFVLSQLNRIASLKKPNIAMLRDSGCIEQDSDQVWLLYDCDLPSTIGWGGDEYHSDNLILDIAKNRHGQQGKHIINFIKENFLICDKSIENEWKCFKALDEKLQEEDFKNQLIETLHSIENSNNTKNKSNNIGLIIKGGFII